MKKWLAQLVLFFIFAACVYSVSIYIVGKYGTDGFKKNLLSEINYGHTNSRLIEIKKTKNIDFLFLGSSHVYRGFDTRIFATKGYTSFNLGSSSQTPIQSLFLLKRYLKAVNPKIVLFEVNPELLAADGVESELDIILNDQILFDNFIAFGNSGNVKIFNTLIFTSLDKKLNDRAKQPIIQGDDTYVPGGYVEKKLVFNTKKQDFKPKTWVFQKKQLKAIDAICALCAKHSTELILVYAPINKSLYASWRNNKQFCDLMKTKGKFINGNHRSSLNDSLDFYDELHLNQNGVKSYNNDLINTLQKLTIVKKLSL